MAPEAAEDALAATEEAADEADAATDEAEAATDDATELADEERELTDEAEDAEDEDEDAPAAAPDELEEPELEDEVVFGTPLKIVVLPIVLIWVEPPLTMVETTALVVIGVELAPLIVLLAVIPDVAANGTLVLAVERADAQIEVP